jgi:hypothetical protein
MMEPLTLGALASPGRGRTSVRALRYRLLGLKRLFEAAKEPAPHPFGLGAP